MEQHFFGGWTNEQETPKRARVGAAGIALDSQPRGLGCATRLAHDEEGSSRSVETHSRSLRREAVAALSDPRERAQRQQALLVAP